ncbi:hypothetical protein [Brevibacillus sp. 179-C9.3 HS]|uniref:hypothetical protein n=1 Tax=unclassified Brevibacillus TaxID=2684853 RepID=UPI0039A26767
MTKFIQKMYAKMSVSLNNQKGAQSIEWIALAAVVLAVLGGIAGVMGDDEGVGESVSTALSDIIEHIGEKISSGGE